MKEQRMEFGDVSPLEEIGLKYTSDRGRKKRGTFRLECPQTGFEFRIYTAGSKTHARKAEGPAGTLLKEGKWWWEEAVDIILFAAKAARRRVEDMIERTGLNVGDEVYHVGLMNAEPLAPFGRQLFDEHKELRFYDHGREVSHDHVRTQITHPGYYNTSRAFFEVAGPTCLGFVTFIKATVPKAVIETRVVEAVLNEGFEARWSMFDKAE